MLRRSEKTLILDEIIGFNFPLERIEARPNPTQPLVVELRSARGSRTAGANVRSDRKPKLKNA